MYSTIAAGGAVWELTRHFVTIGGSPPLLEKPTLTVHVRTARLDDTQAISALMRQRIGVWQRLDANGAVEDVAYSDLSVYERWLHGGPWMSIETGALQLSHLLRGAGLPLVALAGDEVIGYTEVYNGTEPPPYGRHLHLSGITVRADAPPDSADLLLIHAVQVGQTGRYARITANNATSDAETAAFYTRHGLTPIDQVRRMTIPAKSGQVFYKATEHPNLDFAQVEGWHLALGRLGSARYQWESLWPRTFDAISEISKRQTHRLNLNAAGNDAYLLIRQQLYQPRQADVFCWTPRPPTAQLITAIRDWAHREGYRRLSLVAVESVVKMLGLDAEPDGYAEQVFALNLM